MKAIAALFVATDGCYFDQPGVFPYDAVRDARTYGGPFPVVAHPPCQLWGNLAAVNYARYGGEHNRPGNDGGLFAFALAAVERCGGVLEHPAFTKAWAAHGLTPPGNHGWSRHPSHPNGWVCEVWQSAYGHRARKRTWLYYVGQDPPIELDWTRKPGTHQVGHCQYSNNKPRLSKKEASATPLAFRDALISLTRNSSR